MRMMTLALIAFAGVIDIFGQHVISGSSPSTPAGIRLREALPEATVRIPGLKAVLIGAPIDGDDGQWTTSEITNLKLAAKVLRKNGVTVHEFYTPDNSWTQIREKAAGAHFLMYRGHGVYDGSEPPNWVGGFALKDDFVSTDKIRNELGLAPGAIVMLYGCFTAGNSGFDIGKIDLKEAKRRVTMYSEPFIASGSSGYYANWFGDAFENLVAHLFAGKSLGDAYKAFYDYDESTVNVGSLPNGKADLWIDHDNWDGKTSFNYAFVGDSKKTLNDLFGRRNDDETVVSDGQQAKPTGTVVTPGRFVSMSYLTPLEKQVFYELNAVRRDPKGYARYVKELLKYFDGRLLKLPGEIPLQTNEGAVAVEECYKALMAMSPVDSIRPSRGLSLAAKDHVDDQGPTGRTGHDGSDGSSPFDRIERYGKWISIAGENIDYGNEEARRIVLSLLIDDGVSSRGHRKTIMNPEYKVVGIACGSHKKYGAMCVMDFAGGFKAGSTGSVTRGGDDE